MARKKLGDMRPLEYCRKYFPRFYDGILVKKFVIPTRPEFNDRLYTDVRRHQISIDEFDLRVVEQNTIKKANLCNSRTTTICPRDILPFYRSVMNQGITGLGIAESTSCFEDLIAFVGPRSIYSEIDLRQLYKKGVLAVLFRYVGQLPGLLSTSKPLFVDS